MAATAISEPNVSVILTFGDDEETIGSAVRRIAEHLRACHLSFELVAVSQDSGDNSHAVLALVRADVPELRVLSAPGKSRGFGVGAREARGRVLWMMDATQARAPLAAFARARRIVVRGEADAVVVPSRFAVCYRSRCTEALGAIRGRGVLFHRRLERRLRSRRLEVAVQRTSAHASRQRPSPRRWPRQILDAITTARHSW